VALPTGVERSVVAAAAATWLGALAGLSFGKAALGAAVAVAAVAFAVEARTLVFVMLLIAGTLSGMVAAGRTQATLEGAVPEGPAELVVRVIDEGPGTVPTRAVAIPVMIRSNRRWVPWQGPALIVSTDVALTAGDIVRVGGNLRASPATLRNDPVAGRINAAEAEVLDSDAGALLTAGNFIRDRVRSVLGERGDAAAALLAGFLIGDTGGLSPTDVEALRRAGLVHFVAVSGSNVALFLLGWWLVTAPMSLHPRLRAAIGLVGLAVFVMATRWESSVLRAAVMAAAFLVGGVAGIPVGAWSALGAAVVLLILISGQLASDVGFQLSVAATVGILVGAGMFSGREPRLVWGTLGATIAAQAAVFPLLLGHFGGVPLLAPLANLIAAPLVSAATVIGGVAVTTGLEWLVIAATRLSGVVLALARVAAGWPQLGPWGAGALVAAAALARVRRLRPLIALVAAAVIAVPLVIPRSPPSVPTVVFLDVGQGDAVLVRDPSGAVVLVDGGRDPVLLTDALRRHGVRRIDVLVVTHGDVDHVGGLEGIFSAVAVGRLWVPDQPDLGELLPELITQAQQRKVEVTAPEPGTRIRLGALPISVVGPQRRYLSQNDGSIVLWVQTERTALLAGDIEAVAQRELPELQPDVLLVPHHGSATTDPAWLGRTLGEAAVISVGSNTYGHPSPEILEILRRSGTDLHITQDEGDVVVPLVREAAQSPSGKR
jgi:competence protein ComEC